MAAENAKKETEQERDETPEGEAKNSERILDMYLTVNVNIDKLIMSVNEVLNLVPGAVIELNKKVDEPLDIVISNSKKVARGEVVTIGENLGIRVVETEK